MKYGFCTKAGGRGRDSCNTRDLHSPYPCSSFRLSTLCVNGKLCKVPLSYLCRWCRRRSKVGCDVLRLPPCICLQACIVRRAGERSGSVPVTCAIGNRNVWRVRANGDSGRSVELLAFRVAGSSRLTNQLSSGNRAVCMVVWLFAAWLSLRLNGFLFDVSCRAFNLDTEFNSFENHGNRFFAQVF